MNKENHEKLMIFMYLSILNHNPIIYLGISRTEFWSFFLKSVPLLSLTSNTLERSLCSEFI